MAQDYYLGVDGGGTRTSALVADVKGNIVAYQDGFGINFYAAGMEESRENLAAVVRKLGESIDIGRIKRAFIGNAAIDYSVDDDIVAAYKSGILDCDLLMGSDAFAALAGHAPDGPGCVVISGTGSVAVTRDVHGHYRQLGGWGYFLGDDGSAYDIAMKGYRAAIRYFDGLGEETMLAHRIMDRYSLHEPYELLNKIKPGLDKREFAAFSLVVKECAQEGDTVALRILEQSGEYLAELGAAAVSFAGVSVIGIYGSVLLKDKFVRGSFEKSFTRLVPGGVAVEPVLPPVGGAVLLAMSGDGIAITEEITANIKSGIPKIFSEGKDGKG